MKKLLIRADDIGYSEAVTAGILSALESGLVKSAGLMVNMPFTEKSVELIKDRTDICFGLHVNLVIGPACCQDREAVKNLVDGQGRFIASRIRREEFARGLDSMSCAQVCREIEAQAERYEALMGRRPEYMDLHGVENDTLIQAVRDMRDMAERCGVPATPYSGQTVLLEEMLHHDFYESGEAFEAFFSKPCCRIQEGVNNLLIMHPGFVDYDLIQSSSLTMDRVYEHALLCDPKVSEAAAGGAFKLPGSVKAGRVRKSGQRNVKTGKEGGRWREYPGQERTGEELVEKGHGISDLPQKL